MPLRFRTSSMAGATALLGSLAGCATVLEGTTAKMKVMTDPPMATCTLVRDGKLLGTIVQTPGEIVLSKSRKDITVTCERQGFATTTEVVVSKYDGAATANAVGGLVGATIGMSIDHATGAVARYPEVVGITLTPASFPTAMARDQFYTSKAELIRLQLDAQLRTARANCPDTETTRGPQSICLLNIAELQRLQALELQKIEQARLSARVGP